jgi:hypothetical protein
MKIELAQHTSISVKFSGVYVTIINSAFLSVCLWVEYFKFA